MSLTERLNSNLELTSFPGEILTNYMYTYGIAGEDFFRKIKDKGQFTASPCEKCGVVYFPARIFCERCMEHLTRTITVSGKGEVFSYTLCRQNIDGSPKDEPILIAAVKMDGTDGMLIHYLGGVKEENVSIGMRVEAVLKPKNKREGSIFDIQHFKPSRR